MAGSSDTAPKESSPDGQMHREAAVPPQQDSMAAAQEHGALGNAAAAAPQRAPGELEERSDAPSRVWGAQPGLLFQGEKQSCHPLSLSWALGYNSSLAVHSIEDGMLLYACAHTAVIHDVLGSRQYHLQGHANAISCLCVSEDRRWVATADQGPDPLVIIWDAFSGIPVRTIFDSHAGGGICAIAISQDARCLVTISAGMVQRVCVWRWTYPDESPVCDVELSPEFGFQDFVIFNPQNPYEFVSNSKTQVIFYLWGDAGLQYRTPSLTKQTFGSAVGHFTQSAFHFNATQVLTGTSAGKMVVWDVERKRELDKEPRGRVHGMKASKLVPMQKESLTALMVLENCIVTGDVRGQVKFYNGHLQLLACYDHSGTGPIRSISFSRAPPDSPAAPSTSSHPFAARTIITMLQLGGLNAQLQAAVHITAPMLSPVLLHDTTAKNFILSTSDATVLRVATDGTDFEKVMKEAKKAVTAIACHPQQPRLAMGSHCGLLKVWDYQQPQLLMSRIFPSAGVQCLSYDPAGSFLAAGFTDGSVHVLDAISLLSCCEVFRFSRGPITHVQFSHNSEYLATADEKYAVTVYKRVLQNERRCWEHLAGLHSHYKPIRSILFGIHLDGSEPRLLSLGEDRQLIEYDLSSSSKDQLVVLHRHRVEQAAVPLCLAWYPHFSTESFILTANSCYKMKLYNATTKMCRKTLLGPTYGSPLEKMQIFPKSAAQPQKHYLAYITKDKVGLQILPIDGNPHKSSAFICHPDGASDLAISYDGHYIFTAGGSDRTVLKWEVNLNALEAAASLGGEDLVPFYRLLEGGQDGEFFRIAFNSGLIDMTELEDYFYYVQLRSHGIDMLESRQVSTYIPLEEIPSVMRAMGFYPSEEEIEEMINEVKFSEFVDTGEQVTKINLRDFIKLYINHRPAFGLSMKTVQQAFQVLGYENENGDKVIDRGDLLSLLQCRGEHMMEDELALCLSALLGRHPMGGRSDLDVRDPSGAAALMEEEIPEQITAERFTAGILGLSIAEPEKRTVN